jgi:DNA topoisomerase-3
MRLYIAEKPSLARAIASALSNRPERGNGYLKCGEDTVVSWCIGHLLEPVEPAHYNPQWQRWRLETLPIIPDGWERQPRADVRNQLSVLEKLIGHATDIVHAGDPDREGQLLVDEVLEWCGSPSGVRRVLINDLNPEAVRKSLEAETANRRFQPLKNSAEARQRADWLYGINLSRAYTLYHQRRGQEGVFSVGRVQTPVLGLVVERDRAIRDFEPRPYFQLDAVLSAGTEPDHLFRARWQPGEDVAHKLDEDGRLLEKGPAEQVRDKIQGQTGEVVDASFRERAEAPPLPLSLSVLQITAARRHGMGAEQVLKAAQSLYETHQLITYPRSDCRYLPEGHWSDRHEVIAAIAATHPELTEAVVPDDIGRQSKAWNDKEVGAHHAIVPTQRQSSLRKLSKDEAAIYDLVARFYLMQFESDAIHREGQLDCRIAGEAFKARETGIISEGWKRLEPVRRRSDNSEKTPTPLPRVEPGAQVSCHEARCLEKTTQPPTPFTDATLLSAMTGIARFVQDAALRRTLRETDGLGTEATRAAIIQTLFNRGFLFRDKRAIHATDKGWTLIEGLPENATTPDRTAIWESQLERIRQGDIDPESFLEQLASDIHTLLDPAIAGARPEPVEHTGVHCPRCRAPMRKRSGKFGDFWSCSRFPECRGTRAVEAEEDNNAGDGMDQAPVPCPYCFAPLVKRSGPKGPFWGCSRYPACRTTLSDRDGTPDTSSLKT